MSSSCYATLRQRIDIVPLCSSRKKKKTSSVILSILSTDKNPKIYFKSVAIFYDVVRNILTIFHASISCKTITYFEIVRFPRNLEHFFGTNTPIDIFKSAIYCCSVIREDVS